MRRLITIQARSRARRSGAAISVDATCILLHHRMRVAANVAFVAASGTNLDHFFQSRYCPHALRESMVDGFGEETLRDAKRRRLVIPTVNLTDGETYIFRTPHLKQTRPEYDWPIADIIVASAAAPTYFPHKEMPDGKAYADGGLWAINPGIAALAEAARIIDEESQCCGRAEKLDDVFMLSIGTGASTYSLAPPGGDAGICCFGRDTSPRS